MVALSLGAITYAIMQSMVVPAMPEIQRATGSTETQVSWLLTAFLLIASVATPIIGRLGDIYGKDRLLLFCLAGVGVGTIVTAVAPSNLNVIIAGRAIQGVGGGIFPLAFSIIRDEFPADRIASGIGFLSSLIGAASGLGIVAAGLIIDRSSYSVVLWLPLLTILPALFAARAFIPPSPIRAAGKINWASAALMTTGLGAVLLGITEAVDWGWGAPKTLALLLFGVLFVLLWIANEIRASVPLVDMAMMRLRGVWTTNLVAFLVGIGMYSAFILLPLLVQEPTSTGYGFGASVIGGAMFVLPMALLMLVAGQVVGPIEKRMGSRPALLAGCLFTTAGFALLIPWHGASIDIYLAAGLLGFGIGLAYATLATLIVENVEPAQTGVATGMNTVLRTVGGAFGAQLVATILASNVDLGGHPTNEAFTYSFVLCGIAVLIGFLATFAIPARGRVFDPQECDVEPDVREGEPIPAVAEAR
ncbi:MAG: MFS transporter [Solirubrobacterales bacterium]